MGTTSTTARQRKARASADIIPASQPAPAAQPSKLDQLVALLTRAEGATLAVLATATGWQQHSVRGALAGALKKRGHKIVSDKADGVRTYRIEQAA